MELYKPNPDIHTPDEVLSAWIQQLEAYLPVYPRQIMAAEQWYLNLRAKKDFECLPIPDAKIKQEGAAIIQLVWKEPFQLLEVDFYATTAKQWFYKFKDTYYHIEGSEAPTKDLPDRFWSLLENFLPIQF